MKRKIYDELLEWKEKGMQKPLMVIGARQIGKTYIIKEFCKEKFKNYIYINLFEQTEIIKIFDEEISTEEKFKRMKIYLDKDIDLKNTIIFFDEVQESEEIISSLKYFNESSEPYKIICAGRLLGVKLKRMKKAFPVGKVKIINMYPMDFEEFLWANGVQQSTIDYLKKSYDTLVPVSQAVHDTMMKLFNTYIVVGGMPEAVQIYVDTHDIARVISFQNDIITQYGHDVSQYADTNSDKQKIKAIYDAIPSQLNDKNRRFYVNALDRYAKLNRYENSFKWLSDAGVALPCYNVSAPQPPLKLNEKHSLFKLFMGDIGLLCAACMENIQFDILNGNLEINMGSILENAMAQELHSNGFELFYYDSSKIGEVDFVIQNGVGIELLEIKSGKDYRKHKALDNVLSVSEWSFRKAMVFCRDNIQSEGRIIYLPWYMIMFVKPHEQPESMIYKVDLNGLNN